MLNTFPSPVLSVAVEVVKDLEGGDALSGLWTLFTKCKESLKDGRRLENISWRLWYRELSSQSYRPPTPDSDSSTRACHFSLPSSAAGIAINRRELYSAFGQGSKSVPSVGQVICDILPTTQFKTKATDTSRQPVLVLSSDKAALDRAPLLPTPAAERPSITDPGPHLTVTFPRVVISHPTPHPTPPATPVIGDTGSQSPDNLLPGVLSASPVPLSNMESIVAVKAELPLVNSVKPARSGSRSPELKETAGVSLPRVEVDENTLKPGDRTFYLQQSPDVDSPDRGEASSGSKNAPSEMASSCNSTHAKSEPDLVKNHVSAHKRGRGKEVGKHTHHARQRPHFITRTRSHHGPTTGADRHKPAFHVGSASSAGSRPPTSRAQPPSKAKETVELSQKATGARTTNANAEDDAAASKQTKKKIIMTNSSSEYETETDSDDDDSWVSEEATKPVATKVGNRPFDSRRTKSQPSVAAAEARRAREVELEAKRQRDMFAKVPPRTVSRIAEQNRTQSGLLSQLLNPDPSQFPLDHPYWVQRTPSQGGHTSLSSHDLQGLQHVQPPQISKATIARPLAAQVCTSGEVRTLSETQQAATVDGNGRKTSGAYRPKGRPQGMEEDSDTESDNNSIQVPHSVAQQKLAQLAGRRSQTSRAQPPRRASQDSHQSPPHQPTQPISPIPMTHPYNLPPPAQPSTPRTTRRVMLQKELSESLRRNLLWERQVSRTNLPAMAASRKSQSREDVPSTRGNHLSRPTSPGTGPSRRHSEDMSDRKRHEDPPAATKLRRHASGGVLGDTLRPLTSVVQLQPRVGLYKAPHEQNDKETKREQTRLNLARNRSFVNDFHITGW